jgi:hypothetical protein
MCFALRGSPGRRIEGAKSPFSAEMCGVGIEVGVLGSPS